LRHLRLLLLLLLLLLTRVHLLAPLLLRLLTRRRSLSSMVLLLLLLLLLLLVWRWSSQGRLLCLQGHPLHHPRPYLHLRMSSRSSSSSNDISTQSP
jgi:hypothetical protein